MSRPRRFRQHLPFTPRPEQHFRWRGHEVSRLEGFADAVFAFAVTLLVVALEVPRTFEGLVEVIRGFPAFIVCFTLLMLFWNGHYRFFRRYGMEDRFTRTVSLALLLLVLFSVYPLKFLFSSLLDFGGRAAKFETLDQLHFVHRIYGFGLASMWAMLALLHWHALRKRDALQLNAAELIQTRGGLWGYVIYIIVCTASIVLTHVTSLLGLPGWIYVALGPLLALNGWWHGRQVRALAAPPPRWPDAAH